MIPSEYMLAAPALVMVWPCITLAVLFGCAWGIAAQTLPGAAGLSVGPR